VALFEPKKVAQIEPKGLALFEPKSLALTDRKGWHYLNRFIHLRTVFFETPHRRAIPLMELPLL